ncbi:hypothetical protein CPLU01_13923 [Colletotrichum plurivorum]|uniref:Heme haloperoxidase family profile domain-containing protein n=1 Tax=Colletotrichum plurivorum TaxID=2175906 RepID=A0A8H6JNN4_9PEZI|nr:hypothetical protein CPLU01_13923 [Colletotrichum plurivorum]
MLNTLSNHGFLPHDGKNITLSKTIEALGTALNVDKDLATYLHREAITTNPIHNATFFDLDHLSRHNILEHDASLRFVIMAFQNDSDNESNLSNGDSHSFNQTVYDETKSHWTSDIIDLKQAETARQARIHTSNMTNPTFSLSELGSGFSLGETAAYIIFFGDNVTGTANRSFVEYFFENQRLPTELGWHRLANPVSSDMVSSMMDRLTNATGERPSNGNRSYGMHNGPAPAKLY